MQVGFFQNLTNLVEHAVAANDNQAATIVAHSLGCLVSLSFLTGKSQEWLDKHVSSLVAISAPWGGSVTALKGALLALIYSQVIRSVCNKNLSWPDTVTRRCTSPMWCNCIIEMEQFGGNQEKVPG